MLRLFCNMLLPATMTGDLCHRENEMTVTAEQGGCVTDERTSPAAIPATLPGIEIDYYSQARKALSLRSPFDVADEKTASTSAAAPTLPNSLAGFLNRRSDGRGRRRKKSHPGGPAEKKKMSKGRDKPRGPGNIWVETEEYFRELALPDIDTLFEASNSVSRLVARKCFSVPVAPENAVRHGVVSSGNESDKLNDEKLSSVAVKNVDFNVVISENKKGNENHETLNSVVVENGDSLLGIVSVDENDHEMSDCDVSLEWLLGCRNKSSFTSERPLKRRKVSFSDVQLEKVLITVPHGNLSYCHYCGRGGGTREPNRLIVCGSCKVAVHRKCYGVQGDLDGSWLCSWCKRKNEVGERPNPCMLCPNKGGALKPVNNRNGKGGGGVVKFAHLFCCLWTPEVYVDDLKKMEPVAIVGGIKDNRRRLMCSVCKLKHGTCFRCCHGTCRSSFHPLCAREARHRMEVWAKYGSDNVELRAFCCKHSDLQEKSSILPQGDSVAVVGCDVSDANGLPVRSAVNKEQNLKIDCRNGSNIGIASEGSPDKLSHNEPEDGGLPGCRLIVQDLLGCGAEQQLFNTGTVVWTGENANSYDTLNFAPVLKKLIERGKVDVKEVALEIGISPEALTSNINEACSPDVQLKIVNWLKARVYSNAFQKKVLKVKFRPANSFKDENAATNGSDPSPVSYQGVVDPVAVKSVPPRRRTISNSRILHDNKVTHPSEVVIRENGMPVGKFSLGEAENPGTSIESSIPEVIEKNLTESEDAFPEGQGNADKIHQSSLSGRISDAKFTICLQNDSMLSDQNLPVYSISEAPDSGFIKTEAVSSYIHPYISNKLLQILNGMLSEDAICELNLNISIVLLNDLMNSLMDFKVSGPREEVNSSLEESLRVSGCSSEQYQQLTCTGDQLNMEQLAGARKMGVLEYSPEDEVEGELLYFQHRLLQNAVRRTQLTDNLIFNVAKSFPGEIDTAHQQRWDAVLVNQYLCDLREAKKKGRKERRHKEAQAVLAAAAAAAAASSRVSSFRKDALDESMQQETLIKLDTISGRAGIYSQPMPRVKETLSRLAIARISSEKYSDFGLPSSDLSDDHHRLCDICRRSETMLNPILVCSCCKVAVHLVCYRSVRETTGPWYCELCEDLSSRNSGTPAVNFWEKPYVAECGLCGGTTGSFRKSSDGQWVHTFCAEWVFELTFKRGQVHAVEGMATVVKGVDICCICGHKVGVCLKCSYGNCQTTFHPLCARSAGLYMNVRISTKSHHKAYCAKHSSEQRAKAETQKHGIEELKSMRQIRVELERLRLLCERIVKREKLKRELVLCSQDILAFKRDHIARSVLVHSSFFLSDGGSSESATTSINGNTEGNRSCSETVQRSDDVTVDSSVSTRRRVRVAISLDKDPKMDDDCSTSHSHYNHKIPERMQFSGKRIPYRACASSHNTSDDCGWRSKSRKHAETFGKELVMTSEEASVKNLMLPKGYAYVPADCLSNGMQSNQDAYARGS